LQKCDISEAKALDVTLDRDCIDSAGIGEDGIDDGDAAGVGAVCCNAATPTALLTASAAESKR